MYEQMDSETDILLPPSSLEIPVDRFNLVYFAFYFLGVSTLLPWNFFITAKEYFQYKLRNTSLPDDIHYNNPALETNLQILFESYLAIASTCTNLLCIFITTLCVRRISVRVRMVSSLLVIILIFALTVVLAKVNSDSWQLQFFIITLVAAAVINGGTSVMNGSVFGLSCLFPQSYTQAVMMGQAGGGTFAAMASIFSLLGGSSQVESAFGYFLSATLVTILALVSYLLLNCSPFAKHQISSHNDVQNVNSHELIVFQDLMGHGEYFKIIMREIWRDALSVCLVFFVTLSCFPAIGAAIRSTNHDRHSPWSGKYFSPVVCFLMFNLSDWIGRSIAGWIRKPSYNHPTLLLLLCIGRSIFIPLLMFCNGQPRHHLKVIFDSDVYPIIFITLLGLSNGYLSTLTMMYAPRRVGIGQAEGTGLVMTLGLTLGLASGSMLSLLLVQQL